MSNDIMSLPVPRLMQLAKTLGVTAPAGNIPALRAAVMAAQKKAPAAKSGKPAAAAAPAAKGGKPATAAKPAAAPASKPAAKPATKPAAAPAAKGGKPAAAAPAAKPATKPAASAAGSKDGETALKLLAHVFGFDASTLDADPDTVRAALAESLGVTGSSEAAEDAEGEEEADVLADYRDEDGSLILNDESIDALDIEQLRAVFVASGRPVPKGGVAALRKILKEILAEAEAAGGEEGEAEGEGEEGEYIQGPAGEVGLAVDPDSIDGYEAGEYLYVEYEDAWILMSVNETAYGTDDDGDVYLSVTDGEGTPYLIYPGGAAKPIARYVETETEE